LIPAILLLLAVAVGPARAFETVAKQAILVDMATGSVLFEKNADQPMAPASMSKMMTIYMVFERLKEGNLSLDDNFPVSETAWRKGGAKSGSSTMFLDPGKRVRVEDLLRGVIVQSGNDACIVLAEGLAGDEIAFALEMTRRGIEMGLKNTTFKNATGWPHPEHLTTARDLALLAKRTIIDFPDYFPYYSETEFIYNGIRQTNRNPLLYKNMGVDGLKTGHTEASGYGLAATVKRNDRRLILVINGLPTRKARSREPERLLEWGLREFNNYALFKAGEKVADANVWLGDSPAVPLVIEKDLVLTLDRRARKKMKVSVVLQEPVAAPITAGDRLATLKVALPDAKAIEVPLVAAGAVNRLGLAGRLKTALKHVLFGNAE